ncbi:MAG: hypothetical protein BGP10_13300 [Rhodanobacter sp. 68-29]|nr:MAG: hypothetical protein BGP10_13300 [Rhodanobacter sp. 68-29]
MRCKVLVIREFVSEPVALAFEKMGFPVELHEAVMAFFMHLFSRIFCSSISSIGVLLHTLRSVERDLIERRHRPFVLTLTA